MGSMIAFHGSTSTKAKYLKRVEGHRRRDELVQGYGYWENGKGCGIGCTLHSAQHSAYETELGIPQVIARLEDRIFEGLPRTEAQAWPSAFLKAITPGADLSNVWPDFAVWLLTDPAAGLLRHAKSDAIRKSIRDVADLYAHRVPIGDARWGKATADAAADAADAAYAATDAAADAAYAYAYAAYAAYAAAAAAATYAAATRKNWYVAASKKLLSLLAGAK
jgi:hypothetical protein